MSHCWLEYHWSSHFRRSSLLAGKHVVLPAEKQSRRTLHAYGAVLCSEDTSGESFLVRLVWDMPVQARRNLDSRPVLPPQECRCLKVYDHVLCGSRSALLLLPEVDQGDSGGATAIASHSQGRCSWLPGNCSWAPARATWRSKVTRARRANWAAWASGEASHIPPDA